MSASSVPPSTATADPRAFRNALGHFGTGVTVITTCDAEGLPYGVTASSFNAVSLDPPMVLWSQSLKAPSNAVFQRAPMFAVNVLAGDQAELATRFARPAIDRFKDLRYRIGADGLPLLDDAAAHFICRSDFKSYGGDHVVFIATVLHYASCDDKPPLIFWRGQFLQPAVGRPAANSNTSTT